MKSLILRLLLITLSFSLYANAQNSTKRIPGPRPDPTRDASFLWMRDSERAARGLPLTDFDMRNRWRPTTPPTHAPGDVQPLQRSLGKRAEVSVSYDAASGVPRHLFATKGRLSAPGTPSSDAVIGFLRSHPELFRMSDSDLNRFLGVRNYTDAHNGVTHVIFKQFANRIEVFQGDVTAAFDRDGALGNLAGSLHPGLQFPPLAYKIDAFEAVRRAAANVFPDLKYNPQYYTLPQTDDQLTEFEQGPFTSKPWARLVWFPIDGTARLAWRVRLNSARRLGWYDMLVDAVSGELLFRYNLFKSDQGLYFPISPDATPAQQISFNGDPLASPNTWVFGFSPQKTRGNNVVAGEDHDGDLENTSSFLSVNAGFPLIQDSHAAGGNFSVYTFKNTFLNTGSSQLTTFDLANKRVRYAPNAVTGGYDVTLSSAAFTAPGTVTVAGVSTCDDCFASVTATGFTFQFYGTPYTTFYISSNGLVTFAAGDSDGYPRTDKLRVTAAIAPLWDDFDPSANPGHVFLDTFAEGTGTSLRITFSAIPEFLTTNSNTFQITLHNHGAGALADVIDVDYQAVAASVGVLGISPGGGANTVLWLRDFSADLPVTSLVSAGQGIAEPYPAPDINVAIVNLFVQANLYHDRMYHLGFTEAAGNFQYDNFGRGGVGGDMVLAGAQAGVLNGDLCNAFFATPEDGTPGITMFFLFSQQFCGFRNVDGVLDATVTIHELTHGLSNRLVGGPLNVTALAGYQGGALGEGWSDAYAAHFNNTPIMGVYATGNSTTGIRTVAYNNSPLTYAQFGNRVQVLLPPSFAPPIGSIFVPEVHTDGEIWASTMWDLRTQLGGDTFIQLVTDAMKLTPPSPSMLDARNAIYVADVLDSGGAHIATIVRVFAARGMGSSASIEPHATGSSNATTVFAAFDNPKVDPIRRIVWQDRAESGMGGWTLDPNPNNLWHITTYRSADLPGGHSFYFGLESTHTYSNGSRVLGTLTSPPIALPRVLSNSNLVLEFDDFLATEAFSIYDSGYVRVSTDNFATFTQVAFRNLNTIGYYTSSSFAHQRINLAPFAGKTIQVQFYFDSLDSGGNAYEGWYVDNVRVVMEGNDVRLMRNQAGRFLASSGASNFGVFRPSTGQWFINPSGLVAVFGGIGDVPVPADYNADGKSEIAIFRPTTCQWFIAGVTVTAFGCGTLGDIPMPGDYATNGTFTVAVFRQPTGEWFVPGLPAGLILSNAPDAIPVVGDFDGDGLIDLAVVAHESTDELTDNLTWTYRRSSDGVIVKSVFGSLLTGDIPVPADYNGDGRTEMAVFRPTTSQWFINGVGTFYFGAAGDIPVPGDYVGDGRARIAVYRVSGGIGHWFIVDVGNFYFGNSTDIPIGAQN
ncbi:MAG: M36 family metallopeptidase [Acidobacteriia bacterium]|nr:M36 family metallopeptidase [Terriglobia bacterium]